MSILIEKEKIIYCEHHIYCHHSPNLIKMQELNVPEKDVEELLVSLILDNRIHGHIDQVNRLLERADRSDCYCIF